MAKVISTMAKAAKAKQDFWASKGLKHTELRSFSMLDTNGQEKPLAPILARIMDAIQDYKGVVLADSCVAKHGVKPCQVTANGLEAITAEKVNDFLKSLIRSEFLKSLYADGTLPIPPKVEGEVDDTETPDDDSL